ncbi:DUF1320 family protein [Thermomonas sp. S9]|uniref:gp436 family protein n=1 Tax=Thermomonas sp. S9 TaxID=2885203 RepID=UPI00216B60B9|nr:phage protein Gp36 family protein [Thermomonas sp. S9]MCR6497085.1 DUF1320 family protein [Thermomonas sp. S9]MCR6497371.1 DUF1320 family protein [Thermomonas sp. S9]
MAYATLADLITRYGEDEIAQRTDRTGSGVVDAAVAQRALDDAQAEIDGYIASRYKLPLPTVPAALARIACDIARYRLWEDVASDEVRRRYEDARKLLEAIAKGIVSLGLPAVLPPASQPALSLAAAKSGPAPVFGRDGMEGW